MTKRKASPNVAKAAREAPSGEDKVVAVVVELKLSQAKVLARAAVVVTSALDCREVNAAEQGLLVFRGAVARALDRDRTCESPKQLQSLGQPHKRAS
ncbi:hypothetical protein AB0E59_06160 [Lentzea sp. NPDC034063]|uniref:hypothetical protein n=1 Tax=unclassified Lentzea TaxID=2643253 RepID=UPI00340302B3